jgi:hypothetical protein
MSFDSLPPEVQELVFCHLSWQDLLNAGQVSQLWRQLVLELRNRLRKQNIVPAVPLYYMWFDSSVYPRRSLSHELETLIRQGYVGVWLFNVVDLRCHRISDIIVHALLCRRCSGTKFVCNDLEFASYDRIDEFVPEEQMAGLTETWSDLYVESNGSWYDVPLCSVQWPCRPKRKGLIYQGSPIK